MGEAGIGAVEAGIGATTAIAPVAEAGAGIASIATESTADLGSAVESVAVEGADVMQEAVQAVGPIPAVEDLPSPIGADITSTPLQENLGPEGHLEQVVSKRQLNKTFWSPL